MPNQNVAGISNMPNEAVGGVSKTSAEEDVITAYKNLDISVYDAMANENCNNSNAVSNVSGVTDVKPAKEMKSKVRETSKTKPEKGSKVSDTSKSKTAGTSKKSNTIDWTCKFNQPMYNASNFGYNAVSPYGYNPAKKNKRNPYSHG